MPYKKEGAFVERGRIRVSDSSEVVVSDILEGGLSKSLNINKFISTDKYTGFTKGTPIPSEMVVDFLTLFDEVDLKLALDTKQKTKVAAKGG